MTASERLRKKMSVLSFGDEESFKRLNFFQFLCSDIVSLIQSLLFYYLKVKIRTLKN